MTIQNPIDNEGDDLKNESNPSHLAVTTEEHVETVVSASATDHPTETISRWRFSVYPGMAIWIPVLCAVCTVAGIWIGTYLKREKAFHIIEKSNNNTEDILGQSRIEEVIRYIDAKYVDKKDKSEMIDGAIERFLEYLDPHSTYIKPTELKEINEQMQGKFDGIGVEILNIEDTLFVLSVLASGPAAKAGILSGDKIIKIDNQIVAGPYAAKDETGILLSGKRGTKVNLVVLREGGNDVLNFTLTRTEIPIRSINAAYMIDDRTAFIRIVRFNANTAKEFKAHLESMVQEHQAKDLIIDVRQNPGGYLTEATDILDELFIAKDRLLVYTEGRTVHRSNYKTTGNARFKLDKVAVLIDEGSASASEVVAAAVQDLDRGIVVGRRSYGKGLVQEQYSLSNGGALRLTVARYYSPSGRCIQRPYNDYKKYEYEYLGRLKSGEMIAASNIILTDTTKYFTSKGRVVYGGGGIIPDYFVPLESWYNNPYYNAVRQEVQSFVLQYYLRHRKQFRYTMESFRRDFRISDALLTDFFNYCARNGIPKNQQDINVLRPSVRNLLKAHFARQLFTEEAYFIEMNDHDPVVQKARKQLMY